MLDTAHLCFVLVRARVKQEEEGRAGGAQSYGAAVPSGARGRKETRSGNRLLRSTSRLAGPRPRLGDRGPPAQPGATPVGSAGLRDDPLERVPVERLHGGRAHVAARPDLQKRRGGP